MKIGFVTHTAYPEFIGGREHHIHNLASSLSRTSEVVVFAGTRNNKRENVNLSGYNLIKLPTVSFKVSQNPLQIYRVIPHLFSVLKEEKLDLIHAFEYGSYSTDVAYLFSKKYNIPFLLTIYGYQLGNPFLKIAKKFYDNSIGRLLFKEAGKVFFVSDFQRAEFLETMGENQDKKTLILENCISIREYENIGFRSELLSKYNLDGKIRLITVARLLPRKRIVNLVFALDRVIRQYHFKDIKLLIIGPNCGESPNIKKTIRKLNLENNVIIVGPVSYSSVKDFLGICDIFALPSVYEGLPLALLEAMAAGKAVVFTNLPCARKVITDGQDGLLVEPDNIEMLAEAILKLSSDKKLRESLGSSARNKARDFDSSIEAARIKTIYEEIIGKCH